MIKIVWSIKDINKYQTGSLPEGAVKIETPQSVGELMKKSGADFCNSMCFPFYCYAW